MTHTHKRPRKILGLKHEIISCAMFGENTFSELIEACQLAILEYWRAIEEEFKIPCPTCPKPKKEGGAHGEHTVLKTAPRKR